MPDLLADARTLAAYVERLRDVPPEVLDAARRTLRAEPPVRTVHELYCNCLPCKQAR